jgi:hypothetical protein
MTLRDFIYVDVDRVRSLLAQLAGGVVEGSVERLTKSQEARAGGSIFGLFELGGGLLRERATEQTKSLQDALFLLFEDAASQSGLFDLSVDLSDPSAWADGTAHAGLQPGQLLRVTAPTRILDAQHFRERLERFAEWPALVTSFAMSDQLSSIKSPKERERRVQAQVAQEFGPLDGIKKIGDFVNIFLAGQIALRQFPCGVGTPKFGLSGTLLGRPGYLQEEREALFAKYGSLVTEWTVVSQVATVPTEGGGRTELEVGELVTGDEIDRASMEDAAAQVMQVMESLGVAEGPAFPTVTVTPLAVFREFSAPTSAST